MVTYACDLSQRVHSRPAQDGELREAAEIAGCKLQKMTKCALYMKVYVDHRICRDRAIPRSNYYLRQHCHPQSPGYTQTAYAFTLLAEVAAAAPGTLEADSL